MEIAVRPVVTAGVALAAAGMIAVTPVASVVPDVQVPEIQLVGFADQLEDWLGGFNAGLLHGILGFNDALTDAQVGFEKLISGPFEYLPFLNQDFDADNILNGFLNRSFNVFNMGLGAGQQGFLGFLGADFTTEKVTKSLLQGTSDVGQVFNNGNIGGLEGMLGQGLQAFANLTGFPNDSLMGQLQAGLLDLNGSIVKGLISFNDGLTEAQAGLEGLVAPIFDIGPFSGSEADSILNGVVNRGFNVFNMFLDSGQQSFLGVLGADFTAKEITDSLIVGGNQVFNNGTIGGLEGVFGQGYMVLANLLGMVIGPDSIFAGADLFSAVNPLDLMVINPLDFLGFIGF